MRTILIEGGSTACGWFDNERGGWAARLNADCVPFNQEHRINPLYIANSAMPALMLRGALRAYESRVQYYNGIIKPDDSWRLISIISFGVNEAKVAPGEVLPLRSPEGFGDDLLKLQGINTRLDVRSIYVGPQPVQENKTWPTVTGYCLEDGLLEEYGEIMHVAATEAGASYINTRELFEAEGLDNVLDGDGYHPNARGHEILHDAIKEQLVAFKTFEM